jgi:hypothetical protein
MIQIKIEFIVFGDLLNPIEFSNLINISATNYWHKGDNISNNNIFRKETAWEYSTEFIQTYYLEDVSNLLYNKFETHMNDISNYVKSRKLETKINVITESAFGETPALFINKKLINFLYKIEGVIDIDLYILDPE